MTSEYRIQCSMSEATKDDVYIYLKCIGCDMEHTRARFNIKMQSNRYRKYHYADNTVVRSSSLHNAISYTDYYKPDWLLQQFDEWTTRESHQETPACAKHSCQTSFQSEEIWSHNSCTRYPSLASSHIPDWDQNTVDRLQRLHGKTPTTSKKWSPHQKAKDIP